MHDGQAKYWLDPTGKLHLVCVIGEGAQLAHEEWAATKRKSLEALLSNGWVRIQHVVPQYVLIDYRQITPKQIASVTPLLDGCEQIVIEAADGETKRFSSPEEAVEFMQAIPGSSLKRRH